MSADAETLGALARTFARGGARLAMASRRATDRRVRDLLAAAGEGCRDHAAVLLLLPGVTAGDDELDLAFGRRGEDVGADGCLLPELLDDTGEIAAVAALQVAATRQRVVCLRLAGALPPAREKLEAIATALAAQGAAAAAVLDRFRDAGRAGEVHRARREARGSRFVARWRRLGQHAAAGLGQAMLFVLYWTLLVPVGLFARRVRGPAIVDAPPASDPWSQY